MGNQVRVIKTVYRKSEFDNVVDRNFSTFAQPVEVPSETTLEKFFDDYEKIYYLIPATGNTQSHTYLVKKSSELVPQEDEVSYIEPLMQEITTLRQQILTYQQEILDLTTKQAQGVTV